MCYLPNPELSGTDYVSIAVLSAAMEKLFSLRPLRLKRSER